MFLSLSHQKLDVYAVVKALVKECYRVTKTFPAEERFTLVPQIRRAALSVHLNVSEGCSRRSASERKRYFEIARGSIIEIDAALEIASEEGYLKNKDVQTIEQFIIRAFQLLSALIKSTE